MGVIDLASSRSIWRGLDYYNEKKVLSWKRIDEYKYQGRVSGSNGKEYDVVLDIDHPKRSTCNCPFADGRRVVCKHMVAVYFTAIPQEAEYFLRSVEEWEEEEEERTQQEYFELVKYVKSLSKRELQEQLINALMDLEERSNYRYW
ncbi:MAG: SWIM zinc finger family protein [Erysipelotrichales bacterium]|nr:SWIM zinc finger family protein [Erysipelotrichales bacterium]